MSAFTITRRQASIVTLIVISTMISACGYKAPVYYPTQAQKDQIAAREARIKARKEAAAQKKAEEKAAAKAKEAEERAKEAEEHAKEAAAKAQAEAEKPVFRTTD